MFSTFMDDTLTGRVFPRVLHPDLQVVLDVIINELNADKDAVYELFEEVTDDMVTDVRDGKLPRELTHLLEYSQYAPNTSIFIVNFESNDIFMLEFLEAIELEQEAQLKEDLY